MRQNGNANLIILYRYRFSSNVYSKSDDKKENTLIIPRENRNVTKLDNENNNKPETTDVTKSESITNSVEAIKDEH